MSLPLEGIRILAISQFGAGPYATMILAEMGAEIIKIEDPSLGGDVSRSVPPYNVENDSLYFQSFNRNKKSVTLNLKSQQGKVIFRKLVRISHAVFNNLRGDQVKKLGLDYASLQEENPALVCCSLTGFGTSGERTDEPGYDYLMQARAGYMSLTGDPSGPPAACGISVIDHAAGFAAALSMVGAIYAAEKAGRGRDVEVSLYDTAISMLTYLAIWNLNKDFMPIRRVGSAHQTLVPVQTFQTQNGYVVIFCAKEKFWIQLCAALGLDAIATDERFKNFAQRNRNREAVVSTLKKIFLTRPTEHWLEVLRGKVPCAPVHNLADALRDPLTISRNMIIETEHPLFGRLKQVASPIVFSDSKKEHRPAPSLGEHTKQILATYLGYNDSQIESLRQKGVV